MGGDFNESREITRSISRLVSMIAVAPLRQLALMRLAKSCQERVLGWSQGDVTAFALMATASVPICSNTGRSSSLASGQGQTNKAPGLPARRLSSNRVRFCSPGVAPAPRFLNGNQSATPDMHRARAFAVLLQLVIEGFADVVGAAEFGDR